ncbi:Transcriptional regulatory protein LGE1 [Candida viswanathii]|uniref:Transcriptional regulatory protein LGE1 n=1 Tax=Candida viswanathii TaxID=5486 RepID=A0A367XZU5_9ASCO|nr:Transcriptional regulatory protein LGE1 [Candida viswanathii]
MSHDNNNNSNSNSQDGYDSYNSYGKDDYYLNNYRGGGGYRGRGNRGSFRGQRGSNGYYGGGNYRGSGGGGGYYGGKHGYGGGGGYYHGGRGGGRYSGYHDQGYYGNLGYENGNENEPLEGQQASSSQQGSQHNEDEGGQRPGSTGFHRGSFRSGSFRGSYRGRGGHLNGSSSGRPYKEMNFDTVKVKNFNNPWIHILQIDDETTQNKLESGYDELKSVDHGISELQKSKMKLEMSMSLLEKQIDREALHVELTNEKLEEFTYL